MGRPSSYTPELASEICERLVNEPLAQICRDEHIPPIGTVLGWVEDNREGFSERYTRARASQIENMAHEILQIADDSSADIVTRYNEKGDPYEAVDHDHINRSRLRVDTRKWLLSRLRPKVYGDAQLLKHADADGNNLKVEVTRVSGKE